MINAGGVIHLAGSETSDGTTPRRPKRLEAIGDTLLQVFEDGRAGRHLDRGRRRSHGSRPRRRRRRMTARRSGPLGPEHAGACDRIIIGLPYHFADRGAGTTVRRRSVATPVSSPWRWGGAGVPHVRPPVRRSRGDHLDGSPCGQAAPGDRPCADRPARRAARPPKGDGSCWSSRSRRATPARNPTTATERRAPSTGRRASCSAATCAANGIPTPPSSWCDRSRRTTPDGHANGFSWPAFARPTTYIAVKAAVLAPRATRATPRIRPTTRGDVDERDQRHQAVEDDESPTPPPEVLELPRDQDVEQRQRHASPPRRA